jgi:hypothetical protein
MTPYLEILRPLRQRGHNITIVADPHDAAAWLLPHYPEFHVLHFPKTIREHMERITPTLWPLMIRPNDEDTLGVVLDHLTLPTYRYMPRFLRCDVQHVICATSSSRYYGQHKQ